MSYSCFLLKKNSTSSKGETIFPQFFFARHMIQRMLILFVPHKYNALIFYNNNDYIEHSLEKNDDSIGGFVDKYLTSICQIPKFFANFKS